jgi:hypothetical protein
VPHDFLTVLVLLCFGHSLADYPLQGQFLADGKNRHTAVGQLFWPYHLSSHATIHAGFVLIITGSVYLALAEFVVHGITDWMKCEGKISMLIDQIVHYGCKIVWAAVAIWVLP